MEEREIALKQYENDELKTWRSCFPHNYLMHIGRSKKRYFITDEVHLAHGIVTQHPISHYLDCLNDMKKEIHESLKHIRHETP